MLYILLYIVQEWRSYWRSFLSVIIQIYVFGCFYYEIFLEYQFFNFLNGVLNEFMYIDFYNSEFLFIFKVFFDCLIKEYC